MAREKLLRKINVLAIDDKPANLVALEAVLGSDYNLILARSGADALSILRKNCDFGVILLDIQMPDMDGFETAARIKKIDTCREIPIILITAVYREEPFVRRGYEVGAVDYFSKPFDPEILKRKVAIYSSFRQKAEILRERERQVRESEEVLRVGRKLSSILETLPVGVLTFDVEGRVFQTTEEVARICKAIEPMKQDAYGEILEWWQSSGQAIRSENGPLYRALRRGESTHNEKIQIHCVDGTVKEILGSASPLFTLDGAIVGAVFVIQDVSESKKIEEDFEERIASLISLGAELEHSGRQQISNGQEATL